VGIGSKSSGEALLREHVKDGGEGEILPFGKLRIGLPHCEDGIYREPKGSEEGAEPLREARRAASEGRERRGSRGSGEEERHGRKEEEEGREGSEAISEGGKRSAPLL
jgi:hypothetical protein